MRRFFAWFGLLAWLGCSPEPEPVREFPLSFGDVAEETGLRFRHVSGNSGDYYLPEIMGSGVALFDFDNDGDLDVFLVQAAPLDRSKRLPEEHRPGHRLFRNELVPSGELRFSDVTEAAGVGHIGYGMGVATGDYDNDGNVDLFVTHFGPNALYRNNGNGTFTDVTRRAGAGLDDPRWSTSAAFTDYDHDGDLDLLFVNYVDFTVAGNKDCYDATGARDYCSPAVYRPVPDRLFRNDGGGRFTDVSVAAGLGTAFGNGLGVLCADFNGDGRTDIYVANDGNANQLWINNGDGTFAETGLMSGAAYSADGASQAGMGVAAADADADGDEDLFVTNLARETNNFYRNDGRGTFSDAIGEVGLVAPSQPMTGFGVAWFDADRDGALDLFVANGAVTIVESLRGSRYPYQQKNQLFRNTGGRFREAAAGPALELMDVSRGAAFGDIDNDGDIDIVVSNNNGPVRLLRNGSPAGHSWLQVRLQGAGGNRQGLGARVGLLRNGKPALWRRAHTDGSYLSASDPRVHFGLGESPELEGIAVIWPSGAREFWSGAPPNTILELRQGTGKAWNPSR